MTAVHIADIAAWCKIQFQCRFDDGWESYSPSWSFFHDGSCNPLSNAHHLYINGTEVKDLVIPDEVTNISKYAFYGCTGFSTVTIPKNVTKIEPGAFVNCI